MRGGCWGTSGATQDFPHSPQLVHSPPTIHFLAKENVCYEVKIGNEAHI